MVSILHVALKELSFLNLGGNKTYLPSRTHDSVSDLISIPRGFPFGNSIQNTAYVRIMILIHDQLFQFCIKCKLD